MTALLTNIVCFFLIFFTTVLNPKWHRVLRNFRIYCLCIFLSLIVIIVNVIDYNQTYSENDKMLSFVGFAPIFFLVSYKLFDSYIMSTLNRHFYFGTKYISFADEDFKCFYFLRQYFVVLLVIIF